MNAIKKHRNKKGLSQGQLAEKLGVNLRTVWRWENGESFPNSKVLPALSKVLGCSVRELLKESA